MKAVLVPLRRRIAVAAVLLSAPLSTVLSACGFDAQTDRVYTPGVGVNDRTGTVDVLHAVIVSGEDGSGTVVAALVNNDEQNDDALVEVAGAGDDASITVETAGETKVGAGKLYQLANQGEVTATGEQIKPGAFVSLGFSFQRGESVTIDVPVVSNTNEFANVPLPSGS